MKIRKPEEHNKGWIISYSQRVNVYEGVAREVLQHQNYFSQQVFSRVRWVFTSAHKGLGVTGWPGE